MKLFEIIEKINSHYPPCLAYDWDNPGLIFGRKEQTVNKILVSLDITEEVIKEAAQKSANLVISHHPLIFSGIKSVNEDTRVGKILLFAAEHNISLFCTHTNMDTAENGINTYLAKLLNMENTEFIEKNPDFENAGLGKIGTVTPTTLASLAKKVKTVLNTPFVRICGNEEQPIQKIAVASGSCSELIPTAVSLGADVIITGDLKYHTCLDYTSETFSVIDAGHFPTENIVKNMFAEILGGENIVFSSQKDIFKII